MAGELPLLTSGLLFQRSFLDTRALEDLRPPCAHWQLLVDHFHFKKVGWKVMRTSKWSSSPQVSSCHRHLLMRPRSPGSRCILFVTLSQWRQPLLELSLRLALAQSRKPDEVVLVAPPSLPRTSLSLAELHLEGAPGCRHANLVGHHGAQAAWPAP